MRPGVAGWILLAFLLVQNSETVLAERAYGQTGDYRNCWPALDVETNSDVSVMVLDQRAFVLTGDKQDAFVGLSRSRWGIPYDIYTSSGSPLARDLEEAIVNGFNNAALSASAVTSTDEFSQQEDAELNKLLVVTLTQWKSDTYKQTSFEFDVSAVVYDIKGRVLGSNRTKGKKEYSSGVDGGRDALTLLLTELSIEQALANGEVQDEAMEEPSIATERVLLQPSNDMYSELRELKSLLDEGILTQEEFDMEKKKVLER